ncbi:MAG: hypothetical protein ACLP5H_07710 [Desulfomonilaceae bacterium]
MESLSELISLVSIICGGEFDLQGFLYWKELSFLTLLSLFGPLNYCTLSFHRLTVPNAFGLLCGGGLHVAAKDRLLATATAFKANRVSYGSGRPFVFPRDLSARKNF